MLCFLGGVCVTHLMHTISTAICRRWICVVLWSWRLPLAFQPRELLSGHHPWSSWCCKIFGALHIQSELVLWVGSVWLSVKNDWQLVLLRLIVGGRHLAVCRRWLAASCQACPCAVEDHPATEQPCGDDSDAVARQLMWRKSMIYLSPTPWNLQSVVPLLISWCPFWLVCTALVFYLLCFAFIILRKTST